MDRCLEKKIYDRQIKKQGMSDRVVDECNPDAHLSLKDVTNLCHDYDDEHKNPTDEENFKTPVDSYLDDVVKKVIEEYKGCLSREPFYHESLLIDRKEKKLSQAEKRQAHRGYEMEKKACVKQTTTYTGNTKVQCRVVRNDGVTVTRTANSNATRNAGIRSTRWIPAEVWQRQGMTAQEMTLPLDVVIPTNSSDKSNIILKAGQRVMVLKSAKGIYMQLDSGKIIAIRTSSKATDTTNNNTTTNNNNTSASNKTTTTTTTTAGGTATTTVTTTTTNTTTTAGAAAAPGTTAVVANESKSNEVIDITADGDNVSNQTTSSGSNSNSSCSSSNTTTNHIAHLTNNNNGMKSTTHSNNSFMPTTNVKLSHKLNNDMTATTTTTIKDIKFRNDAFMNNGKK